MPFPVVESNLLIALWSAMLGLVTVGVLWNTRDIAVYLWGASGLLGAGYIALSTSALSPEFHHSIPGIWTLGALVVFAALLKVIAIGRLTNPDWTLRAYWPLSVGLGTAIALGSVILPDRRWVSFMILLMVIGLMVYFVVRAYGFGRRLGLNNAKFFAAIISLQVAAIFIGGAAYLPSGADPLLPNAVSPTFGMLALSLLMALLNNALFIALVLDVNLLKGRAAQAELLRAAAERSRSEERERMLSDMHDGLGSQLATARMKVERAQMSQPEVAELLRECMADLHLMVDTLRDQGNSLATALIDYRFRTERRLAEREIAVDWQVDLDTAPTMPAPMLLQILRIVQEALNNAVKHSAARKVRIVARYRETGGYVLQIMDDGIGLPAQPIEGRGLSNMKRRARDLGGRLRIERSAGGVGTEVELLLPMTAGATPG